MQFQHTATRRWLPACTRLLIQNWGFQHTATRRWLQLPFYLITESKLFQHTATRRWLPVSETQRITNSAGFNTQPPEGGCLLDKISAAILKLFQHTATRRWLPCTQGRRLFVFDVSTHSHPKVAAKKNQVVFLVVRVSTHSHPKVAALQMCQYKTVFFGFNTQPPEGGCGLYQ